MAVFKIGVGKVGSTDPVGLVNHGQVATFYSGTAAVLISIALVGSAIVSAQGDVEVPDTNITLGLTGEVSTSAAGTLVQDVARTLSGSEAIFFSGTSAPSGSKAITGQEITSEDGDLVKSGSLIPSGQVITTSTGTVSVGGRESILTGSETVVSQGDIAPRYSGQYATFSQGSIASVLNTKGLTGSAITVQQSSVIVNADGTVPLVGEQITGAQQTIFPSWEQGITGDVSTSDIGTLLPVLRPTDIVGQVITTGTGTATAQGESPVTVNISGVEAAFSTGNVQGGYAFLSGDVVSCSQGSSTQIIDLPLTGIETTSQSGNIQSAGQDAVDTLITSGQGSTSINADVSLTGLETTSVAGSVAVTTDVFEVLTGEEITTAVGTLIYNKQEVLTGSQITSAQYNVGAPGGVILSGTALTVSAGDVFITNDRTFALTGESFTTQIGNTFASPLAFVTGQELTISAQEIGPRWVVLSGLEIEIQTGEILPPIPEVIIPPTGYSGGWGGAWYKKSRKTREEKIDEIVTSIEDVQKKLDITTVKLEQKRELRRQEKRSKYVTEEIRKLLDEQDNLKMGVETLKMQLEAQGMTEDEIALILALAY